MQDCLAGADGDGETEVQTLTSGLDLKPSREDRSYGALSAIDNRFFMRIV
jgi:hypothetical protein